ncbi:MAG TPA: MarC family protein [Terriglobales bacterium]|jgi:multiple antibiotic resistance protein
MDPIDFIKVLAVVFAALFPVVNPVGDAPIFLSLTRHYPQSAQKVLARKIAAYGFALLAVSFLFGSEILSFFGVSLAVIQITGGLILASTGWSLLNQQVAASSAEETSATLEDALQHAFYPLTLPITVGPGCISIAITLGAHLRHQAGAGFEHGYPRHFVAALLGMFLLCLLVWVCYTNASRLVKVLGKSGTTIVTRLSALILMAIGVQILCNGMSAGLPGFLGPSRDQVNHSSYESQPCNHLFVHPVRVSVSRSISLQQETNAQNS